MARWDPLRYMAKRQGGSTQAGAGGGLGGLLGGLLGGGAAGVPNQAGVGGLGSMLDLNNDGSALDDILRMGSKLIR